MSIRFTQRFVPPRRVSTFTATSSDSQEKPKDLAFSSELKAQLRTKGTREPIAGASVRIKVGTKSFTAVTDARGEFVLGLPDGEAEISVSAYRHRPFLQKEKLLPGKRLNVVYVVERSSYEPRCDPL